MSNSLESSAVREADSEARDSEEARGTTAEEAATGRVDNNMLRSKLTSQHEFLLDDFHDTGPLNDLHLPIFEIVFKPTNFDSLSSPQISGTALRETRSTGLSSRI